MPSPPYTSGFYDPYSTIHSGNPISTPMHTPLSGRNTKRDFGTVFDTSHMNQPVHNGMRPDMVNLGRDRPMIESDTGEIEDIYDDMDDFRSKRLVYKRADGSQQTKKCPSPVDIHG